VVQAPPQEVKKQTTHIRLVVAKWVQDRYFANNPSCSGSMKALANMLSSLPVELVDRGSPLELAIRNVLFVKVMAARSDTDLEDLLPFLVDTAAAKLKCTKPSVCFLPKFMPSLEPQELDNEKHPWQQVCAPSQWATMEFPAGSIGHPAPMSSSSDLIWRVHSSVVIAFAAKLYLEGMQWAEIRREIELAKELLGIDSLKSVVLVIVSTELAPQVVESLQSQSSLLLAAGEWHLEGGGLKKRRSGYCGTAKAVLEVPDGVQVGARLLSLSARFLS
jgi:hypothetical protein